MYVWRLFAGMAAFSISFHSQASTHALAALLANPQFIPAREPGEGPAQAYARCACDYADALQTELTRRQAAAAADAKPGGVV